MPSAMRMAAACGRSCTAPPSPRWWCLTATRPARNYRRNAFDTGEYGIGQFLDPLKLGCDCLGHIRYVDVWSHDWFGRPRLIKQCDMYP